SLTSPGPKNLPDRAIIPKPCQPARANREYPQVIMISLQGWSHANDISYDISESYTDRNRLARDGPTEERLAEARFDDKEAAGGAPPRFAGPFRLATPRLWSFPGRRGAPDRR